MTGAWTAVLPVFLALAGRFSWPGALEADGRALTLLPAPERAPAIERLIARYGTATAAPLLLPLLTDPDPTARLFAARVLAHAGLPAADAVATSWVRSPTVPLVDRAFGLDVLAHAPALSPAARQTVEQAARDPEPAVRAQALEALEPHPLGASLPVVLGALDDDNREVRMLAVRLAAAARDPRAALPLLDRLEDGDRQVRLQAIFALGQLRDPRVAPALVRLASEGTIDLRTAAIDALGALKTASATPLLTALARRHSDDLGRHAALALGDIATPAAVAALVAALRTPPVPAEVRVGLQHAGAAAVTALSDELEHGTPASASLAIAALGEIGDRRATAPVCAAADRADGEPPVAWAALEALASLADPAAIPTLVRAAESSDAEIRRLAFSALVAIADPRSTTVLDRGLADPDARVRTLAAHLAATIDARGAAPALAARLGDDAPGVRRAAARALAQVGEPSSALVTAVLAAITEAGAPSRDDDESDAIGDALERLVTGTDAERLARAFATAHGDARAPIARALARAHAEQPLVDRSLIDLLMGTVEEGGLPALAAADALAVARVPAGAAGALARVFADAEPMTRARLCAAIARTTGGGAWLAALIGSRDESPEVRAAAAWAARGQTSAHTALETAARAGVGPIASNARAALAAGSPGAMLATAVRLRAPDDTPLVARWVTLRSPGGAAVEARTDLLGVARVFGLPGDRLDLRAAGLSLRAGP
jgi:HEAT repeat protein